MDSVIQKPVTQKCGKISQKDEKPRFQRLRTHTCSIKMRNYVTEVSPTAFLPQHKCRLSAQENALSRHVTLTTPYQSTTYKTHVSADTSIPCTQPTRHFHKLLTTTKLQNHGVGRHLRKMHSTDTSTNFLKQNLSQLHSADTSLP
jgi:hypothetical protein